MFATDHDAPPPTVFVAYTHDSPQHKADVLAFTRLLVGNYVLAELDQWAEGQRQDWYAWAHQHITASDYTIIVASPQCKNAGDGRASSTENRGAQTEMSVIRDLLQGEREKWLPKLLPVVLPGRSVDEIPDFLQPYAVDHYKVDELTDQGVEDLLRVIFRQPKITRPTLGRPPVFSQPGPVLVAGPPCWQRLPAEVDVWWRADMETGRISNVPSRLPALEVHLVPVGIPRIPMSELLPRRVELREHAIERGILGLYHPAYVQSTDEVLRVFSSQSTQMDWGGIAMVRTGQRSAWMSLPRRRYDYELTRAHVVHKIRLMLSALAELGPALPDVVVPTVGVDPADLVGEGRSTRAISSSHSETVVRLGADEFLTSAELLLQTRQVAVELTERLLAKFPESYR